MIALRRHNGQAVIVNADLIETVETDDEGTTTIALTTGNVLAVLESPGEVLAAVVAFRRSLSSG